MDWLVWIWLIIVTIVQVIILRKLQVIDDRVKVVLANLNLLSTNRVSSVAHHHRSDRIPPVDAKGKTTTRDTSDIPIRGARIGTAIHRKVYDARESDDS